jgi:hypothetical protein
MHQHSDAMSSLVEALLDYLNHAGPLIVTASPTAHDTAAKESPVSIRGRRTDFGAIVELSIATGWHVNANPAGPGLTPLEVQAEPPADEVVYPSSQLLAAAGVEAIPVLSNTVQIELHSSLPVQRCRITYQACDETRCVAPVREVIDIDA